ncbi:hypothetical protein V2O64_07685 [Verrucomicrobiaceae bacterium 227]
MKTLAPWLLSIVLATLLAFSHFSKNSETTGLRNEIVELKEAASQSSGRRGPAVAASNRSQKSSMSQRDLTAERQTDSDADIGETLRKIIENPIGKAMMSEESRIKAARIYKGLIKEMNLNEEEEEYFTGLLAADIGSEDATGMKLLNATSDEERLAILEEMEAAKEKRKQEIKDFLGNDEDYDRFAHYQDRRREYEQLSSVKSAIASTGTPLSDPQESRLVEAMYDARTESGMITAWEGREGMQQFANPGVADRFTADWDKMQAILANKADPILQDSQKEAFVAQQTQMRDLALFGIKMAEGMIRAKQNTSGSDESE